MSLATDSAVIGGTEHDHRGIRFAAFAYRCTGVRPRCGSCCAEGRVTATHTRQRADDEVRLIHRIAQQQPLPAERDVGPAVKTMLKHMTACLAAGGRIEIRGFASFSLHFHAA